MTTFITQLRRVQVYFEPGEWKAIASQAERGEGESSLARRLVFAGCAKLKIKLPPVKK